MLRSNPLGIIQSDEVMNPLLSLHLIADFYWITFSGLCLGKPTPQSGLYHRFLLSFFYATKKTSPHTGRSHSRCHLILYDLNHTSQFRILLYPIPFYGRLPSDTTPYRFALPLYGPFTIIILWDFHQRPLSLKITYAYSSSSLSFKY